VGDAVNLEADLLAKYTERLLQHGSTDSAPASAGLSRAWLSDHGWG
jgi:riboflavin synthase